MLHHIVLLPSNAVDQILVVDGHVHLHPLFHLDCLIDLLDALHVKVRHERARLLHQCTSQSRRFGTTATDQLVNGLHEPLRQAEQLEKVIDAELGVLVRTEQQQLAAPQTGQIARRGDQVNQIRLNRCVCGGYIARLLRRVE